MVSKLLWSPKRDDTNINKFQIKNSKYLKDFTYKSLHEWSVHNKKEFWSSFWDFSNIIGEKKGPIIENEKNFIKSKFFKNCELNFTENIIQKKIMMMQ